MKRGFSLVELSIVLVILGLLVGGILAGQSLIRAGELRSVSADTSKYTTAIYAFRDKYFGLPGDITNATSIWSGTANGSGDQLYNYTAESARAWQQLSLAGLIEGQYVGTNWGTTPVIGTDIPAGKISGGGYIIGTWAPIVYGTSTANVLMFGAPRPGLWQVSTALLTTQETWNLDTKMDDGVANTGKVRGAGNLDTTTCTGTMYNVSPGTDYLMSATGPRCYFHYYF